MLSECCCRMTGTVEILGQVVGHIRDICRYRTVCNVVSVLTALNVRSVHFGWLLCGGEGVETCSCIHVLIRIQPPVRSLDGLFCGLYPDDEQASFERVCITCGVVFFFVCIWDGYATKRKTRREGVGDGCDGICGIKPLCGAATPWIGSTCLT